MVPVRSAQSQMMRYQLGQPSDPAAMFSQGKIPGQ